VGSNPLFNGVGETRTAITRRWSSSAWKRETLRNTALLAELSGFSLNRRRRALPKPARDDWGGLLLSHAVSEPLNVWLEPVAA
jgi:hypothetical protein